MTKTEIRMDACRKLLRKAERDICDSKLAKKCIRCGFSMKRLKATLEEHILLHTLSDLMQGASIDKGE